MAQPKEITITVELPTKTAWPGAMPYTRIGEIRTLTGRESEALTRLYSGVIGRPLNQGRVVNSPERAVRFLLNIIADQLGIT